MIFFGWFRSPIVLGVKADLCEKCSAVTPHAILRVTHWAHVFWVPVLLIGLRHRLVCGQCGTERGLGWRQVRSALKTGRLPMPPRPGFKEWGQKAFDETGRFPQEVELEPVEVNPKRGPWDLWLKAWPVLAVAVIAFAILSSSTFRPNPTPAANTPQYAAHQCWEAADGTINGCKLTNGFVSGKAEGKQITCWFTEPLLNQRLYCQ
jgi:hypothetical protein